MDDVGLVRAAVAGDRSAFADIYDRYADRVHAFATSVLRDPHEAADVTQDTFLVAARRLDQLRDPSRLRPWLFAIARHEAFRRSKARQRTVLTDEVDDVASAERSTEDVVSGQDAAGIVAEAAAGLTERDRAVLDLSLRHGLEGEDLGAAMGISAGHASVLAGRVRDRVEKSLGALLVARLGRDDCGDLQEVLADWDGSFSPLVRKRVARHVERCSTCAATKRRVASPAALLSSMPIVVAPPALRGRVLDAFDAHVAASGGGTAAPEASSGTVETSPSGGQATGGEAGPSGGPAAGGETPSTASPSTAAVEGEPPTGAEATADEAGGGPPPEAGAPAAHAEVASSPAPLTGPDLALGRDGFPISHDRRRLAAVAAVLAVLLLGAGLGLALARDDGTQSLATGADPAEAEPAGGRALTFLDGDKDDDVVPGDGDDVDGGDEGSVAQPGDPAGGSDSTDPGGDGGGSSQPDPGGPPTGPAPTPPPPPPPPPPDTTPPTVRAWASPRTIYGQAAFCPPGPTQATINVTATDASGIASVSSNYGMSGGGGAWSTSIGPFVPASMGSQAVGVVVTVVDGAGNRTSRTVTVAVVC